MVQVDVFWAYGLGASLALAAGPKLATMKKTLESRYMVWTALFLALVWSPTGMLLLIRHPSWETMQAAENFLSMNEFVVLAFGITNVTQGILGFWIGCKLVQKRQFYFANLNWMLGYFAMFFILVYGWDGLGYDRFFYDRDMLQDSPAWEPGAGTDATLVGTVLAALKFITSSVSITLYLDGIYLLPPFAALMFLWHRESVAEHGRYLSFWGDGPVMLGAYLFAVFVVCLGAAIFCAFVVNQVGALLGVGEHVARALGEIPASTSAHIASYFIGIPLALLVLWLVVLKPGGIVNKLLSTWCLDRLMPSNISRVSINTP